MEPATPRGRVDSWATPVPHVASESSHASECAYESTSYRVPAQSQPCPSEEGHRSFEAEIDDRNEVQLRNVIEAVRLERAVSGRRCAETELLIHERSRALLGKRTDWRKCQEEHFRERVSQAQARIQSSEQLHERLRSVRAEHAAHTQLYEQATEEVAQWQREAAAWEKRALAVEGAVQAEHASLLETHIKQSHWHAVSEWPRPPPRHGSVIEAVNDSPATPQWPDCSSQSDSAVVHPSSPPPLGLEVPTAVCATTATSGGSPSLVASFANIASFANVAAAPVAGAPPSPTPCNPGVFGTPSWAAWAPAAVEVEGAVEAEAEVTGVMPKSSPTESLGAPSTAAASGDGQSSSPSVSSWSGGFNYAAVGGTRQQLPTGNWIASEVIEQGAGRRSTESTALHWAAAQGYADVCMRLLHDRADPRQPDRHGRTALELASQHHRHEVVRLLQSNVV